MPRILIVDDNEIVRDMLAQFFSDAGFDVVTAVDGRKVVHTIQSIPIDCIITDIIMPEKEGIETILEVRKLKSAIPIIAMSGGGMITAQHHLKVAKMIGANFVFEKPVDNSTLLKAVKSCLGQN